MGNRLKKLFRSELIWIIFIALITALSSEIKLVPFSGENFRFGLGSILFFLLLLIRPPKNYLLTAFLTAFIIVSFRVMLQSFFGGDALADSLTENYPGGIFYFIYVLGFKLLRLYDYGEKPLVLGILATSLEIFSNSMEHLLRILVISTSEVDLKEWWLLIAVAIFRSFFVVGIYSSVSLKEQKQRLQEQLQVGANLYIESLYLKKSMNHIEQIMAESYDLYRVLKKEQDVTLSKKALKIAQEIHEVKKDSQRIYAGLSEITALETDTTYMLSEVLNMSIEGNRKYTKHLNKEVTIIFTSTVDFVVAEKMLLMAIINNVISNAVESIEQYGRVQLHVIEEKENIQFSVADSGKGIEVEDLAIIFDAGFTTKYSEKGVAATGIGLSHVQEAIKQLNGHINVTSKKGEGTLFIIKIPRINIEQRSVM
ncbi:MAG: GHKL domain-containing protein [Kurthia sp.]|nr:GHKL domain-containing protein [Candidatus Kurthia equi]